MIFNFQELWNFKNFLNMTCNTGNFRRFEHNILWEILLNSLKGKTNFKGRISSLHLEPEYILEFSRSITWHGQRHEVTFWDRKCFLVQWMFSGIRPTTYIIQLLLECTGLHERDDPVGGVSFQVTMKRMRPPLNIYGNLWPRGTSPKLQR